MVNKLNKKIISDLVALRAADGTAVATADAMAAVTAAAAAAAGSGATAAGAVCTTTSRPPTAARPAIRVEGSHMVTPHY